MRPDSAFDLGQSHHRRDIQGLRGVAVLLVVAYHAGRVAPGGFIGVDVFFVISGFVIGASLLRELEASGKISLLAFYRRRVRRLLPALSFVLVTTLAASSLVLDVGGGQQLAAATARAASLFFANVQLLRESGGYFTSSADRNPFLHTWSLSIEEQFYAVFPIILVVAALIGGSKSLRSRVQGAIVVASLASFVCAVSAVSNGEVERAFFSTWLRAWEFGSGAALATVTSRLHGIQARHRGLLLGIGAVGLVGSAVFFSDATRFPGPAAVLPVGAAAAIIAAGTSNGPESRVLASQALVWLGDRSYGWYLWHWPMIVLATVAWPHVGWLAPAVAVGALVPTEVSYRLVEQPVRFNDWLRGPRLAVLALLLILVPIAGSLVVQRSAEQELSTTPDIAELTDAWRTSCSTVPWPEQRCTFGPSTAHGTIALIGDSHANALGDVITRIGRQLDMRTAVLVKSGCPASLTPSSYEDGCEAWQRALVEEIEALDPEVVVIANRSPLYVYGQVGGVDPPNEEHRQAFPIDPSPETALELWSDGLDRFLAAIDRPTLIFRTVPEHPLTRADVTNPSALAGYAGLPRAAHLARTSEISTVEEWIAALHRDTRVFDPTPLLCDEVCGIVTADGRGVYLDGDHLSPRGSFLLEAPIRSVIVELTRRR